MTFTPDTINCIFCKIVRGEIKSEIVYNDDNFIGLLDINPKALGHTVIIPKKHFENNILVMPSSLGVELVDAIKEVGLNLIKDGKGEAFNIIVNNGEVAGQVIKHTHIHVIPRKKDDGLKMNVYLLLKINF
jgi:histidine triad (HIT) family protein